MSLALVMLVKVDDPGGSGGGPDEEASVRERWGHDRVNAGSPHAEKDVGRCQ